MARPRPHKRVARAAAVSILTFTAALAALWCAPRVSDAVAAWLRTPQVRAATLAVAGGLRAGAGGPSRARSGTGRRGGDRRRGCDRLARRGRHARRRAALHHARRHVRRAPARRTACWSTCARASTGHVESLVHRRRSTCRRTADPGTPQAFTEAMWTGAGPLRAGRGPAGGRLRRAGRASATCAWWPSTAPSDADAGATVLGVLRRTVAAIAGLELAPAGGGHDRQAGHRDARQEWGADESYRTGSPDYATADDGVRPPHRQRQRLRRVARRPSVVRGAYYYHTRSLHWSDIGYNFLIDRYGTIYEGRYGGITKGVDRRAGAGLQHRQRRRLGDRHVSARRRPPAPRCARSRPFWPGSSTSTTSTRWAGPTLTCGYGEKFSTGEKVDFAAISGHRDANYTECPGNKLYALLPGDPQDGGRGRASRRSTPSTSTTRTSAPAATACATGSRWPSSLGAGRLEARGARRGRRSVRSVSGSGTAVETTWSRPRQRRQRSCRTATTR